MLNSGMTKASALITELKSSMIALLCANCKNVDERAQLMLVVSQRAL